MSQYVRLSRYAIFEIFKTEAFSISAKDLYILKSQDDTNIQLLNQDTTNNSRNFSYSPYNNNIRLKPTPSFYFGNTYWQNSKYDLQTSIQYKRCRLLLANGFSYAQANVLGVGVRVYCKTDDGKDITLLASTDLYNNTRIKARSTEIVIDSVGFDQAIEFDIIDIDSIVNNPAQEFVDLADEIFGTTRNISDIFIEFFEVGNDAIIEFEANGEIFEQLNAYDVDSTYFGKTDTESELFNDLSIDESTRSIKAVINHTKFNPQFYLSKYLASEEFLEISYAFTINCYGAGNIVLSTESIRVSNSIDEYAPVYWKPVLANDSSIQYAQIQCVAYMINASSNISITRAASIIVPSPQMYFGITPITVNVETFNAVVNKQVTKKIVESSNELPKLISSIKPIYITSSASDSITLTKFDTTINIKLPADTNLSQELFLIIGENFYKTLQRTIDTLTFTVSKVEYNSPEAIFYILDENNSVVTYGPITRL